MVIADTVKHVHALLVGVRITIESFQTEPGASVLDPSAILVVESFQTEPVARNTHGKRKSIVG